MAKKLMKAQKGTSIKYPGSNEYRNDYKNQSIKTKKNSEGQDVKVKVKRTTADGMYKEKIKANAPGGRLDFNDRVSDVSIKKRRTLKGVVTGAPKPSMSSMNYKKGGSTKKK